MPGGITRQPVAAIVPAADARRLSSGGAIRRAAGPEPLANDCHSCYRHNLRLERFPKPEAAAVAVREVR